MLTTDDLETLTKRAILLYNRTHSPSTKATLILLAPPLLTIEFSGIFCTGCGTQNITDGFADQYTALSGGKIQLKLSKTTQTTPRAFQTTYNIKSK